ncbi:MAG: hypothetical protein M0Z99_30700 [Betaproteobacteria bacterium]|nr:hypothetical protein [Betaproteobacteria bacterium]
MNTVRPGMVLRQRTYAIGVAAVALVAIYLVWHGHTRWLAVGLLAALLFAAGLRNARLAIVLTLTYTFFLGDIRRLVNWQVGWPALDPLLLVAPLVVGALALGVLLREQRLSPMARMVLALMALMTLEIANPLQGGLRVGLGGALFYLVPLLWFWLGRRYASPAFVEQVAYRLVLPVAVLAAIVGLLQTLVGFAPWEQAWITMASQNYAALNVGGAIRAFAFFTSSASYATFLGIAAVIAAAGWWLGHRRAAVWLLLLLPVLFLDSSRGIVVKLIVALLVVWALRRGGSRGWYLRFALGASLLVGVLAWGLPKLMHTDDQSNAAVQALVAHQVEGLTHPLNPQTSTLQLHWHYLKQGLISGFTHPLGQGLGASTLAAQKFGGHGQSTEVDFGDMLVDLGFGGGFLYLALMARVLWQVWQRWRFQRECSALLILGVLVVTGAAWLIAGQYEISALVWLLIGAVDHGSHAFGSVLAGPSCDKSRANCVARP